MSIITSAKSEYGGTVYTLQFHDPPTMEELDKAIHQIDDCPFGWRFAYGPQKVDGKQTEFVIKIHND